MEYQTFSVPENSGKNVYYFLKNKGFSENFISNLRKSPLSIILNGKPANTNALLSTNDKLEILSSPNNKTNIKSCDIPLDIVFEDAYYILIYKPSGLSCMPNKAHYDQNLAGAIVGYMQAKDSNFTLRIINRLDKDTAGFILIAKSSLAMQEIREITKSYLAICEGVIEEKLTINKKILTISKNGINQQKRIISLDGKEAITHVIPLKHTKDFSLVKLELEHGRTHQIRLHLSSINHPLVGDEIYGKKSDIIFHTALLCNEFSFFHPYRKEYMQFSHEPPLDFQTTCEKLKLNNF